MEPKDEQAPNAGENEPAGTGNEAFVDGYGRGRPFPSEVGGSQYVTGYGENQRSDTGQYKNDGLDNEYETHNFLFFK